MPTRRQLLRLGAASGIVSATGVAAGYLHDPAAQAAVLPTDTTPAPAAAGAAVAPFSVPLTVPPTQRPVLSTRDTDYYDITIGKSYHEIIPGYRTQVYSYQGGFPGPTIRARSGRKVVIRQHNHLDEPASVHLHGGSTEAADDGSPMIPIAAGDSKIYTYPNVQPHATLWMHDHAHHLESEHLYRGLSNLYLLTDRIEDRLPLPSGRYDVPLMLRDVRLDDKAQIVYEMDDYENRDTILVNGRPQPRLRVDARKYRFRLVNSSNLRMFWLSLSDGTDLTIVGADGGLLPQPFTTPKVVISPGERLDLIVDFSKYARGTRIVLNNGLGPGSPDRVGQVMCFDVGKPVRDPSSVPGTLRTLPEVPDAVVTRDMVMHMDEVGSGTAALINGKAFDPNRIDTEVAWGTTEEWTITNTSGTIPHNFHTHLVQFRVVARDGQPASGFETGLKDTVLVWPGEFVTLRATFDTYRGVYPYHCHMVDHSAMGMMAQMRIS